MKELTGNEQHVVHSSAGDYWQLLKPRIMYLVVFTSTVGMVIAPGSIHPVIGLVSALCVALGSGAAGVLNMWYDSDIDSIMSRTRTRPIPAGRVTQNHALECGVTLSVLSVFIMAIAVNYISSLLLAASIFFYVVVYTMLLKRRTTQNIVIGGIAGAFPPVIGWTTVMGSISLESVFLFLIIFLWTPPHFWALSLLNRDEYSLARIPMLAVHCIRTTRLHILIYSSVLFVTSLLVGIYMSEAVLYEIMAVCLGIVFMSRALRIYRENGAPTSTSCMEMFSFSIYYLFLIFSAIALCH